MARSHDRLELRRADVVEGSWQAQKVPDLAPQPGDIVIQKSRGSAFYHTAPNDLLRARGVNNTIVTGCITEGCVLWTAAYAMHEGYYVTIVRDCVASFDTARHEQALAFLATKSPVYDLDDVLTTWTKLGPPSVDRWR